VPPDALTSLYLFLLFAALAAAGLYLLRRWQARQALLKRLAELSALAEIGQGIAAAELDLRKVARAVYTQTGHIVDTTFFQLGLFEDDRYRLLIWIVDGTPQSPAEFRLSPGNLGIVGWLRDKRQSLLVYDFERQAAELPARPRYESPNPPRSAVFVPLLSGERALGAIVVQSRQPSAFSEEDRRLLSIVASHAAAALENARLYEQASRRATQLELLAGVAERINVLQPLPALYRQVADLVAEKFSDYSVSYYECDGPQLRLRVTSRVPALPETQAQAAAGVAAWVGPRPEVVPYGDGPVGQAAQTGRSVTVCELPELGPNAPSGLYAACSELAVPVEIDGRVLGVLDVISLSGVVFDETIESVFKSLASQMSIFILESEVYAAEQRRTEHLVALAEASRTVAGSLELDDLLDEVLDVVDEHFGYKSARIFLLHEDQLIYHAGIGTGAVAHAIEGPIYELEGQGIIALTGRTRQPIVVDDTRTHPEYVPGPGLENTRAEMAAPMVMGGRLMGVFDVQSEQPNAFKEEDARTLQTLADTLAVAVRNARLFEFERRRRRLAEIMREVSVALTSTLQLDNVLELILDGLALVVSYDAASILLRNDAGELILRATRGAPGAEEAIGLPLDVKMYAPGETVPAVLPFHEVDTRHEYHDLLALPEPHACLGAALAPGGEHLGYLVVDCAGQRRFAQGEVELVATFASQAAVAIENARLYTAQREQAWISTALLQVAEVTSHAEELDSVLETVTRLTPMLVGVDRCAVLLSAGQGRWRMAAYAGTDDALTPEQAAALFPEGLNAAAWPAFQEMLSSRAPVVLEPEVEVPPGLRELFVGVVILLPLLAKGEVEGALVVGQVPGETPFTTHRIRLMSGIANQAALAVESAMLSAAQKEEAWVSTALLQVAESVAGQTLESGLETVARLTPILVGIDKLLIYQWESPAQAFRARQVSGVDKPAQTALLERPVTLADLGLPEDSPLFSEPPPWHLTLPDRLAGLFGSAECYVWPLRARGDVLGALVVDVNPSLGRGLAIMNGVAYQVAMAMENARLAREVALQERLERELEVGRDIQASFLPREYPQAPGWEVSAVWRAARQVGGDFYDFIPLAPAPHGARWGVVIADVADKGVPAALFMALSRTLVRTVSINRVSPGDTLRRVNELILSDARSEQFVTVFYAVWEPATGRLVYAIGGHNPPLHVDTAGQVRALPGRGIALGVLEYVQYQEHEITLQPGESVLMFTDGLTDALNVHQQEFGLARVQAAVAHAHALPAREIMQAVVGAVEEHVHGIEAFDDMTLVVLKRTEDKP
jgi:serine phosphatase RsbU (regulator of sigma subunit)/transcriptional regulator with GAF, ATPase, and Fis domain